ncbi:hypothetical protein [Lysinibacillus xylanilyticus]|uniref:hypothetical protein n=1 Tax=Lysinibacillus xylanilyticus TaxID=582475 RepID=UPI0036DEEAD2
MIRGKWGLTALVIISCCTGFLLGAIGLYSYKAGEKEVSEELLHAFYTFNLPTIAQNDERIKELTTDEIYQSHTISSSNRQLRVYLKFQGKPTEAKIISHKNNTIFYYINSEGFDKERTFAMQYHYSWGKIDKVVEYEVFFLPQSSRSDLE